MIAAKFLFVRVSDPLISIRTPACQAELSREPTINFIRATTFGDRELIAVEDGSRDRIEESYPSDGAAKEVCPGPASPAQRAPADHGFFRKSVRHRPASLVTWCNSLAVLLLHGAAIQRK